MKYIKIFASLLALLLIFFPLLVPNKVTTSWAQQGRLDNETVIRFGEPHLKGYIVPLDFYSELMMWLGVLMLTYLSIRYALNKEFNLVSSSTFSVIITLFVVMIKLNISLNRYILISINPLESPLISLMILSFLSSGLNILHSFGISLDKIGGTDYQSEQLDEWINHAISPLLLVINLISLTLAFFGVYFTSFTSNSYLNIIGRNQIGFSCFIIFIVGLTDLIIHARIATICSTTTLSFVAGTLCFISWRFTRWTGSYEQVFLVIILISSIINCMVQWLQARSGVLQIFPKPSLTILELYRNPPRWLKKSFRYGLVLVFLAPLLHIILSSIGITDFPFNFILEGLYEVFGELYSFRYSPYRFTFEKLFYYFFCNIVVYSWMWILLLKLRSITSKKRPTQNIIEGSHLEGGYKSARIYLLLICILTVVIYGWRYTSGFRLIGLGHVDSDMDWYLSNLEEVRLQGFNAALRTDRPLFFIILNLIQRMTRLSSATLLISLPVVLGVVYTLSIYQFTMLGTGKPLLSLFASFFASTSLLNLNISMNLLANQLGMIFLISALTFYLEALNNHNKKIYVLSASILSLFTVLIHSFSGLLLFAIITSLTLIKLLNEKNKAISYLYLKFITFIGSFVVLAFAITPLKSNVLMRLVGFFNTFISTEQYVIIRFLSRWPPEFAVLQILTIFGILLIINSDRSFDQIILSWILIISIIFPFVANHRYFGIRMMLTYPTYLLSAIAINHIYVSNKRNEQDKKVLASLDFLIILLLLFLFNGALTFTIENIIEHYL